VPCLVVGQLSWFEQGFFLFSLAYLLYCLGAASVKARVEMETPSELDIKAIIDSLGMYYEEGVVTRNALLRTADQAAIDALNKTLDAWQQHVATQIAKVSPGEARAWNTLGDYKRVRFADAVKGADERSIAINTELINRLRTLIQRWTEKLL